MRNREIQKIFETADDSLQGVLGNFFYVMALYKSISDSNKIVTNLPNVSNKAIVDAFPHTFSWIRYYHRQELIDTNMPPFFELYQSRVSLTTMVSVFDDSLSKFISELKFLGYPPQIDGKEFDHKKNKWGYMKRIKWAFYEANECIIGDTNAMKRLPRTFGIIDEARRLRNLIMHNHGIFDKQYEEEASSVKPFDKVIHPDYKNADNQVAVIINYQDIINFSKAHIEVLHILHNQIQKKYFNHFEPYSYRDENKLIKWNSAFWGNANLNNVDESYRKNSYLII